MRSYSDLFEMVLWNSIQDGAASTHRAPGHVALLLAFLVSFLPSEIYRWGCSLLPTTAPGTPLAACLPKASTPPSCHFTTGLNWSLPIFLPCVPSSANYRNKGSRQLTDNTFKQFSQVPQSKTSPF